jgi:hypothetical protein
MQGLCEVVVIFYALFSLVFCSVDSSKRIVLFIVDLPSSPPPPPLRAYHSQRNSNQLYFVRV